MDNSITVFKQLPRLNNKRICPFCSQAVTQSKNCTVLLYDKEYTSTKQVSWEFPWCNNCDLFFGNDSTIRVIRGFHVCVFGVKKGSQLANVRRKMKEHNYFYRLNNGEIRPIESIPKAGAANYPSKMVVTESTQEKHVFATNYHLDLCPLCHYSLVKWSARFALNGGIASSVEGHFCRKCDSFYTPKGLWLKKHISADSRIYGAISKKYLIPEYEQFQRKLKATASSLIAIHLLNSTLGTYKSFVIVSDKHKNIPKENIIHYTHKTARKLLLAISKNEHIVLLDGFEFNIIKLSCASEAIKANISNLWLQEIRLRRGGGLFGSDDSGEMVDVFLYSQATDNFEIVHATYDKYNGKYYMDPQILRNFIKEHGKPDVPILAFESDCSNDGFANLRDESLLHAYGYNVGQKDNFSDGYRHALLSEIIDLQLMSSHSIIALLNNNISMRKGEKYKIARSKWENDIEFVSNYKANPSRFIIAKNVIKQ